MSNAKTLSDIFAQNVRHYRKSLHLTQEQLASLSGLHRTYIGGIESNSRNVSIAAVEKIAGALKVEAATLFSRRGQHGK